MLFRALPLTLLTSAALLATGCPDDSTVVSASESSSSTQATTDAQTSTGAPTPTTGPEPTTDPSTSTGPGTVTETSTSTGPATVTDTDPSTSTGPVTDTAPSTDSTAGTDSTSTSTAGETETGGTGSSSGTDTGAVECSPGQVNCDCMGTSCEAGATCIQGKCLPIGDGSCEEFEFDFECDEPNLCPVGSDPFDCCPSFGDGVCEEFGMGGECPPYSDYLDCGYCPFENNGICESPEFCPAGTDVVDCCASPQNGVCEEQQFGGECQDGSDFYDCGTCPYEEDGECDVPQYCPENSDQVDCCATPQNGVCEEMQFGGECEDGSDFYDCGVCPYEDDGLCDVPQFCPENSDVNDCG